MIEPKIFGDLRGFFMETYKQSDFEAAGIKNQFIQDNCSRSKRGVLRGLHYQIEPYAQSKLIRCIKGVIFDVAVDIRKGSPFFGQWVGEELSDENKRMLYVPAGFAHGFLVVSDYAEIMYKCDQEYSPEHEKGILWNDPQLAIDWPASDPLVSERDTHLPQLREAEYNFNFLSDKI